MGGGGSTTQCNTVGYKYYASIHMVLCYGPVDSIMEIQVGGRTAKSTNSLPGEVTVDARSLFGGDSKEGGVAGTLTFYAGTPTEPTDPYLLQYLPDASTKLPAFRGLANVVLKYFYLAAMNPYFKPWAFLVRRVTKLTNGSDQWYPTAAAIGTYDMNPAHIVRECLTNEEWGMGYPESVIDDASFRSVADTLYNESFGISISWVDTSMIEDFLMLIIEHINGLLYVDPKTGKFKLVVVRDDYDVATIPALNESSVISLEEYQRQAWGETVNEIVVEYTNLERGKPATVVVQNLGNIQQQGQIVSQKRQYPGITNETLAYKVAQRDLKTYSYPLSSVTLLLTRRQGEFMPGDVFKLSWAKLGLVDVVYRVVSVRMNPDRNLLQLHAVEDSFAVPTNVFVDPEPPGWVDPTSDPVDVVYYKIIEMPYYELAVFLPPADFDYLSADVCRVATMAVAPSYDAYGYSLLESSTDTSSDPYEEVANGPFTPTAILASAITPTDTTLTYQNDLDMDLLQVGDSIYVEDEMVQITAIDLGAKTIDVIRGVMDTIPVDHASAVRIYGGRRFAVEEGEDRAPSEQTYYKFLTKTPKGELAENNATARLYTTTGRFEKPYPPGYVRWNNEYFPAYFKGDLTISWYHRDRTLQTDTPESFTRQGDIGPEPGVTYTIYFYDELGNLAETQTGLTGTSATLNPANDVTNGHRNDQIRVRLWSDRGGVISHQRYDYTIERMGYGLHYGRRYGV